jgi:hypothetical protein
MLLDRLLFGFFFITLALKCTIAKNFQHNDNFKESLTIKPLLDGKVLTHFQFNVRISEVEEGKTCMRFKLCLFLYANTSSDLFRTFFQSTIIISFRVQ